MPAVVLKSPATATKVRGDELGADGPVYNRSFLRSGHKDAQTRYWRNLPPTGRMDEANHQGVNRSHCGGCHVCGCGNGRPGAHERSRTRTPMSCRIDDSGSPALWHLPTRKPTSYRFVATEPQSSRNRSGAGQKAPDSASSGLGLCRCIQTFEYLESFPISAGGRRGGQTQKPSRVTSRDRGGAPVFKAILSFR